MPGNSKIVSSNQTTFNSNLEKIVLRNKSSTYRKSFIYNEELRDLVPRIMAHCSGMDDKGVIIDSGCGTGLSTITLAKKNPGKMVIGFDKSYHRLSKCNEQIPSNAILLRQDCEVVWNLLFEAQVMCEHYLLYPNPWPKKKHLKRRWYAHPIFPRLLATSKSITMRTNWRIYALEFSIALSLYGVAHSMRRFEVSGDCLTLFELKYSESGHELYEITTNG